MHPSGTTHEVDAGAMDAVLFGTELQAVGVSTGGLLPRPSLPARAEEVKSTARKTK